MVGNQTENNFQFFSKSISTWVAILRHEHDNVINPGHRQRSTVGELEETLPESGASSACQVEDFARVDGEGHNRCDRTSKDTGII